MYINLNSQNTVQKSIQGRICKE